MQGVPERNPSAPFKSYCVPTDGRRAMMEDSHLLLKQFLNNLFCEQFARTYNLFNVPQASQGALSSCPTNVRLSRSIELQVVLVLWWFTIK
jgi:hypothetical protein